MYMYSRLQQITSPRARDLRFLILSSGSSETSCARSVVIALDRETTAMLLRTLHAMYLMT